MAAPTEVIAKSTSGSAAIVFTNATCDPDGTCHCEVRVTGRYNGSGRLTFHPGEDCLVTFLRTAVYEPPVYRTDRHFGRGGVTFGIGRHDESGHIGLTIHLTSEEEPVGAAPPAYWRLETILVLTSAQIRELADELSDLFGYERS